MIPVLTIACSKGGTGKTTTAVHLAAWFAGQGYRVLLLDTDGQGHVDLCFGLERSEKPTMADVLMNHCGIIDAVRTARLNLDVVPSDARMAEAELSLQRVPGRRTLKRAIAQVARDYDLVIIDTAPASSLSAVTQNALYAAQHIIAPVQANDLAVDTLEGLYTTLMQLQDHLDWEGELSLIIPTMVDLRRLADNAAITKMHRFCGSRAGELLRAGTIADNTAIPTATSLGKTIWEHAPNAKAAQDYARVADIVRRHIINAGEPAGTEV